MIIKTKPETRVEKVEFFCNQICIICKGRIMALCGEPVIRLGGCCSKVEDDKNKITYIRPMHCHYKCYQHSRKHERDIKTNFNFNEVDRIIKDDEKEFNKVSR